MSKFFNRNWKAGFTLVELIVVIAILAILAGIAIPVYSGYIKKANEAADNQLLAAVNTAFGAACVENRTDPRAVNAKATVSDTGVTVDPYDEQFQVYYAGNGSFKVFKSLVYDKANGYFTGSKVDVVNNGDGTYTVTLANGQEVKYTVSDEAVAAIQSSTFGTEMTMSELMGDVSGVVGAAVSALGGNTATLANIIGTDALKQLGLADDEGNLKEGVTANQLGNALVLMVANNTGNDTAAAINAAISGGGMGSLVDTSNMPKTLANVAAVYGMMEGYANSEIGKTTTVTYTENGVEKTVSVYDYFNQQSAALKNSSSGSNGLQNVLNMMNTISSSSGLATYMDGGNDSQAMKDLTGYISAMQVISGNSDVLTGSNDILTTGFDNTDLEAILNGILG